MNLKNNYFSTALSTMCLFAVLLLGVTTSCKNDDDDPNSDKYIVTNSPETVGATYAELSGELYPDRMPDYLNSHGYEVRPGVELSLSENFAIDLSKTTYIKEMEKSHLKVIAYDLRPATQYYYRMFVEVGEMRFYADRQSFTTQSAELPCTVGDVTEISFNSAEVSVKFTQWPPTSPMERVSYGVACSTDKDIFSKTQDMADANDDPAKGIKFVSVPYNSQDITAHIGDLQSNTTYYYCAYIMVDNPRDSQFGPLHPTIINLSDVVGDSYTCQFGPVKSFTTGNRDGLMTIDEINPKFVLAEVTGTSKIAASKPGLRYVLKYEHMNDDWPSSYEVDMTLSGDKLSALIRNLSPNTLHKCWIAAKQGNETVAESEVKVFSTRNPADDIKLGEATDVSSTTATVSCVLEGEGYATEQWCNIYYGEDKNNLLRSVGAFQKQGGGEFTVTLKNLKPNTTYYYQGSAHCVLREGLGNTYRSEIKNFTTLP